MITFEHVVKHYRGNSRPALNDVSFTIERGEFVFLVGASGSGKSSCLQLMFREEMPNSGSIHVLGNNLSTISTRKIPMFRRNLGVVFQDFRLLQNKNVYENVAFTLQVTGKSRGFIQQAVPDILEMVGLGNKEKRYPNELSGGEQQRVAIARAIVNKPSILIADEPTGNLDPATSLGIMQLLKAINASGTTVVMATHEAAFVDVMKQRVIELSEGTIVRDEKTGGYGQTAAIPLVSLQTSSLKAHLADDDAADEGLGEGNAGEGSVGEGSARDGGAGEVAPAAAAPGVAARPAGSAASESAAPAYPIPVFPASFSAGATGGFSPAAAAPQTGQPVQGAPQGEHPTVAPAASAYPLPAQTTEHTDSQARSFLPGQQMQPPQNSHPAPPRPLHTPQSPTSDHFLDQTLDPIKLAELGLAHGSSGMAERLGIELEQTENEGGENR